MSISIIPRVLKIQHLELCLLRIRIDIGIVILSSAQSLLLGVESTLILIVGV